MKNIDFNDLKVIDLETCGLSPKPPKRTPRYIQDSILNPLGCEILEIGVTEIINQKIGKNYSRLIKPKKPIPKNITEITHISEELVKDAKSLEDVLPAFREYLGDSLVIGHNVKFDVGFLNYFLGLMGLPLITRYVCTLEMLKNIKSYKGENNKLGTACEYYNIKLLNAHRAYADTYATAQLLLKLLDEIGGIEHLPVTYLDIF